jgi:hypothetical protein
MSNDYALLRDFALTKLARGARSCPAEEAAEAHSENLVLHQDTWYSQCSLQVCQMPRRVLVQIDLVLREFILI